MSIKHLTLKSLHKDIADSIRNLTGSSAQIKVDDLPDEIDTIGSNCNATPGEIAAGKTAITNTGRITGSMANKSGVSLNADVSYSNNTFTVAVPLNGYYDTNSRLINTNAVKSVLSFKLGPNSTLYAQIKWQYPNSGPFNGVRILRKLGSNQSFSGPNDSSATIISSGTTGSAVGASGAGQWYYFNDTTCSQKTYYTYIVYPYIIVNGYYHYGTGSSPMTHYRCEDRTCTNCTDCNNGCANCCDSNSYSCSESSCPWQTCTCDGNTVCCDSDGCNNCCDFDCTNCSDYTCGCYTAYGTCSTDCSCDSDCTDSPCGGYGPGCPTNY